MSMERWQSLSRKELLELGAREASPAVTTLTKDELVAALAKLSQSQGESSRRKPSARPKATAALASATAAARHYTNGTSSAEEQVERSKYDVGVPTKDLSAKVPKDLPAGYGKDRIVVHGARSLLAARLLGTDPPGRPAGRGRPRPGLARRQADPAPARRHQPRHHQRLRSRSSATSTSTAAATTGTSTSPIRRAPTASTSATSPATASSTSWPAPTSSPRRAPA